MSRTWKAWILEPVVDEGVHDGHGFGRDLGVEVDLQTGSDGGGPTKRTPKVQRRGRGEAADGWLETAAEVRRRRGVDHEGPM